MNKFCLGISILLATAVLGFAQKNGARTGEQVVLTSGTAIEAELQKTVDVNTAKVGDHISLKLAKSIRQDGQTLVPKGANLIGRVTDVQRRTKENATSKLGMVFSSIRGRDLFSPISVSIVSITNAFAAAQAGDSLMTDTSGSSRTTSRVSGGGSGGGGLLGGVGSTVGGLVNATTQTAGGVTNGVASTAGAATGTVGRTISGVQISSSASGSAGVSNTLSSSNKNLRIEKGATFNLRVSGYASEQE